MNTNRLDIYKDVHKGVRKALFDLAQLAGSTEFNSTESLVKLKEHFARAYNLLETHAHSEDTYVEPMVQECDANIAAELSTTHNKLETIIRQLQIELNNLDADQDDVIFQGREFYLGLTKFVGEYLKHIADEEQIIMPLLWEKFDDQKLMEVSVTIRANIPPPVMMNFLSCMIPAMNHAERSIMLGGMKQAAPTEAFNAVCQLGQNVLPQNDWEKLQNEVL